MLVFVNTMGEVVHIHAVKELVYHLHKARCSLNGVPFVVQIIPFYIMEEGMIYDVLGIGNRSITLHWILLQQPRELFFPLQKGPVSETRARWED